MKLDTSKHPHLKLASEVTYTLEELQGVVDIRVYKRLQKLGKEEISYQDLKEAEENLPGPSKEEIMTWKEINATPASTKDKFTPGMIVEVIPGLKAKPEEMQGFTPNEYIGTPFSKTWHGVVYGSAGMSYYYVVPMLFSIPERYMIVREEIISEVTDEKIIADLQAQLDNLES